MKALADIEHERWANWQRHLHCKGRRRPDGSLLLSAELVSRWERQSATPYKDLSEKEKESDREQIRKCLPTIVSALRGPARQNV